MSLTTGYVRVKKTLTSAWIELPVPAEGGVTYEIQTIIDDARNSSGTLVGSPVGQDKIKLNIEYPPLDDAELQKILSVFDRERGGVYKCYVEFYDPRARSRVVRYMYVGDRSFDPWIVPSTKVGQPKKWINCQCNLIEC